MSLLPEALSRRQFFQTSAALAGATTLRGAEPHLDFPSNPRDRLSLTSWPFRRIMETPGNSDRDRSKTGIDAKDFAAMAVERFGIHNINPLTSHFRSTDPAYLEELRAAVAKAGSHIVDLGHGGRPFYHPDKAKRQAGRGYCSSDWLPKCPTAHQRGPRREGRRGSHGGNAW